MQRHFDWDPQKAIRNRRKHGVSFEESVTAFYDPYILSRYDDDHSETEDRWVVKKEYDFSNAEQGRFYTRPADAVIPYYLEPDLDDSLRRLAQQLGKKPEELLRVILEKELALLDQIGPAPSAK